MVVVVVSGSFALDVGKQRLVVVDANGSDIFLLERIAGPPHFQETGDVLRDFDGLPCIAICAVNPGEPVRLSAGMTVLLPENSSRQLCSEGPDGLLRVYAGVADNAGDDSFSWAQLRGIESAGAPASPGALRASLPNLVAGCKKRV
jgi:hypothetical protein